MPCEATIPQLSREPSPQLAAQPSDDASRPVDWSPIIQELRAIRRAIEASQAEAVNARDAASLCRLGVATWHRMNSAGQVPRPVKLAGSVRWLRAELLAWLQAGAPDRKAWEAMKRK
jgi:predicted DNA-binding transcriptional regulator AlpA